MLNFLSDYQTVDPTVLNRYQPVDCETSRWDQMEQWMETLDLSKDRLTVDLGISYFVMVPEMHCQNSYGVVLHTSGGGGDVFRRVLYSGDCCPSTCLVRSLF